MLQIHISTSGAAFDPECAQELARILHDLADRMDDLLSLHGIQLFDINGNNVGSARLVNQAGTP